MPFVSVPRDLTKVKSKVALNLTFRQIVCFGGAAIVGVPVYFLARGAIGNSSAVAVMIVVMLPAFFVAMYEKDGQPAEKILRNILRWQWFFPQARPYRTENFYHIIEKEAQIGRKKPTAGNAGKASVAKRKAGPGKQKRPARHAEKQTR
jgi:hypothetical protein